VPTQGERKAAAEVLANAKAKTARVKLCLDGDLLDRLAEATAAFDASPTDRALAQAVVDLEDQVAATEVEFVFKGMGRGRWLKMHAEHPPTDEQKAHGADVDTDTFPFEAMAGSLVEPALTAEELRELNDGALDEVSFGALWGACLQANIGGRKRPPSEAARQLLSEPGRSARRSSSESAEAS
jgi:hypothetical protein